MGRSPKTWKYLIKFKCFDRLYYHLYVGIQGLTKAILDNILDRKYPIFLSKEKKQQQIINEDEVNYKVKINNEYWLDILNYKVKNVEVIERHWDFFFNKMKRNLADVARRRQKEMVNEIVEYTSEYTMKEVWTSYI